MTTDTLTPAAITADTTTADTTTADTTTADTTTMRVTHPAPGVFEFATPTGPLTLASLGEMALALHLSSAELARDMTDRQVAALIVAGVQRAGLATLQSLDLRLRQAEIDRMAGRLDPSVCARRRRQIIPAGRDQLCTDLASHIVFHAEVA
jgi:hypothetical protein